MKTQTHIQTSLLTALLSVAFTIALHAQNNILTYQGDVQSGGSNFTGMGQFKFALVTPTNTSTGATAFATVNPINGQITAINVTFGGSGYVAPPTVSLFGLGSGGSATAQVSGGVVTGITVNNPGSGYFFPPTVIIAAPPPTEAYFTRWSNDGTSVDGSEPVAAAIVPVNGGLFTARLGDATQPNMTSFSGELFALTNLQLRVWFDDGVNGSALLHPPQPLTAAPYAFTAGSAASLSGTYGGAVTFTNSANSFRGSGTGLTALNAAELSVGTMPDARLSANIARTNQVWLLGGNGGTTPGVNFLGTTDSAPLALRAGNREVMRLEGQASGYRIIAGVNSAVSSATTNSAILGGRDGVIEANAPESTIVGGLDNVIRSTQLAAFIGGGARNEIRSDNEYAAIVGGRDNRIGTNTLISLVVGGGENHMADNVDGGLMVGGFRNDILGSDNPNSRQIAPIIVGGSDNTIGEGRGSSWAVILGGDANRIGAANHTVGWTPGSAGWSFTSDRNTKERIVAIDATAVLEKVSRLPIAEWSYIGYAPRHIGPMAQDFHAAFPLNDNDKVLNGADLHGVALAAIQGLNQKVEQKETENAELKQTVNELKELVQAMNHKLNGGVK